MWVASSFATTSNPLVSLSMRWTMPGRISPPMPERLPLQCQSRAFTSVPSGLPGAGWTTIPLGLFTTRRWSSSYTMSSGMSCGTASMGFASGISSRMVSPALSLRLLAMLLPLQSTWPSATRPCSALRESPVSSPLRKRSMRWPAASVSTINSRCSMLHRSFEGLSSASSSRMTSTQSATPTQTQMSAKLKTAKSMNRGLM